MQLSAKQISNIFLNWFGHIANLLVMFFLTPFVIESIGKVEYGIWILMTVVTGYMGVLDIGIRSSTGRYIMLYLGKQEHDKVDETIRTSSTFFFIIGLILIFAGLIGGQFFTDFFEKIPAQYGSQIVFWLPLLALNIWFTILRALFNSVLAAHERFDFIQLVSIFFLIIKTIITIYFLKNGHGLGTLVYIAVAIGGVSTLCTYVLAKRIYPRFSLFPFVIKRERVKELTSYGIAAFICTAGFQIIRESDTVMVGFFIGIDDVAVYAVASMLVAYSWGFVEQIGVTLFPAIQKAASRQDYDAVKSLYFSQVSISILLAVPLYAGFISFGAMFIDLWVGEGFENGVVVLSILSIAKIIYLFTSGMWSVLGATGKIAFNAKVIMSEAIVNITLSSIFVVYFDLGLNGIALGSLIAVCLTSSLFCPLYFCLQMKISKREYAKRVIFKIALVAILSYAINQAILNSIQWQGWIGFIVQALIAGSITLLVAAVSLFGSSVVTSKIKQLSAKFG